MKSNIIKVGPRGLKTELRLHDGWSFETFVLLNSNREAYELSQLAAVEQAAGLSIMILGDTGLGKTHLLNAVGHEWRKSGKRVLYAGADVFNSELIWAERHDAMDQFRAKYRDCDLLLMGPLQFLVGKSHAQEELLEVLRNLQASGATIVLEGGTYAQMRLAFATPLTRHLVSYMTAEIKNPNLSERKVLCRELSRRSGIEGELDESVVDFIAMTSQRSGRYVEAALARICAHARHTEKHVVQEGQSPSLGVLKETGKGISEFKA